MQKKILRELKERLERERVLIEGELKKFAKKDEKLKGDWDTTFPKWDGTASGGSRLETAADEVEEYSTLLPIEHNLELKLRDINLALEKIEKAASEEASLAQKGRAAKGEPRSPRFAGEAGQGWEKYGICEKCKKEIEIERLKVIPEARFCLKCKPS